MQYYFTIKRNEVPDIPDIIWMNLENMINKTSQSQKTTKDHIYVIWQVDKPRDRRKVAGGWRKAE